ncbi:MAG: sporulation sigma factor-processing peptidase [Sporolactobacillus sp.]
MANMGRPALVYRPSALGEILKAAREYSVNENRRTKIALSKFLGMTTARMTAIEDGVSRISLNDALDWCEASEDRLTRQAVLHIFGVSRLPTDPRLIEKIEQQLVNYIDQAQKGITAAQELLKFSKDMRPGRKLDERQINEIKERAGQIDDTYQSAECVLMSIEMNWGVSWVDVQNAWTSEALVDQVAVSSVDRLISIEREKVFG